MSDRAFAIQMKQIFEMTHALHQRYRLSPPIEEQPRIVEVLDACDQEIRLLDAELEALKLQKCGLMQKLLTGDIHVKTKGKTK
jgi:type I restriction enzyme S subunit